MRKIAGVMEIGSLFLFIGIICLINGCGGGGGMGNARIAAPSTSITSLVNNSQNNSNDNSNTGQPGAAGDYSLAGTVVAEATGAGRSKRTIQYRQPPRCHRPRVAV